MSAKLNVFWQSLRVCLCTGCAPLLLMEAVTLFASLELSSGGCNSQTGSCVRMEEVTPVRCCFTKCFHCCSTSTHPCFLKTNHSFEPLGNYKCWSFASGRQRGPLSAHGDPWRGKPFPQGAAYPPWQVCQLSDTNTPITSNIFARQEHKAHNISIQNMSLLIAAHQFLIRLTYIEDMYLN